MKTLENNSLRPRWQADLGEPVVALDVLPGGNGHPHAVLAGGSEGAVRVIDPDGSPRYERDLGDALLAVTASPDGTRIAALGVASRRLWSATDGEPLRSEATGWSASAAWDKKSQFLAVADGRRVRVLDRDGATRWSSAPLSSTVTNVLWPRGRLRVAASSYQGVTIFEPETNRITNALEAPGAISGLASAPNGRWVVGGSQDATLHGWKVDDGSDFEMSGFPATVSHLAFEDGGRWMACESAEVLTCWDFSGRGPTGRAGVVLIGHQAAVSVFAWVPGHRQILVSGDQDGNVLVWRIAGTTQPGDELRPASGVRDDDPVTAIITSSNTASSIVYIGRRSGRIDALTIT
ncbi:hypothetical protein [Saccharopolyspora sp. NPDC050642]|uniref:WD40 repeat domain-containing protein n=1 Tax=Saccharopolyspora sp. NPDC050642 TaxID=3157099 RepID=UPI0033D0DE01